MSAKDASSCGTGRVARAKGCDCSNTRNALVFIEAGGLLSSIDLSTRAHRVLGRGYLELEDVLVCQDGLRAFVTEKGGILLHVDLECADRAFAEVIVEGLSAPHLLQVDEAAQDVYVVEHGYPGRLSVVNIATGRLQVLSRDLYGAIALSVSPDGRTAFVQEQKDPDDERVWRVDLKTGQRQVMVTDIRSPFYQSWNDPAPYSPSREDVSAA